MRNRTVSCIRLAKLLRNKKFNLEHGPAINHQTKKVPAIPLIITTADIFSLLYLQFPFLYILIYLPIGVTINYSSLLLYLKGYLLFLEKKEKKSARA